MKDKFLKQKRITIVIVGIILTLLCLNFPKYVYAGGSDEQKNVLIINSYHQGFTWSKDVNDGIF